MFSTSSKSAAPVFSHVALAVALLLSGCASPYVVLDQPAPNDDVRPKALANAIAGARAVEGKYRDKVVELGEGERALSNGLLSLGTLIVGLSVAKVHPSAINGVVLAAGGLYTVGTFNTDKHRAQVYVAGMKALDCAVDAVTPLVLGLDQEQRLTQEREQVPAAIELVSAAIGDAEKWSAQARVTDAEKFTDAVTAIAQAIVAGQAAIGQANDAASLAAQRMDKPYQIANDLRSAVRAIDRAVLDEIRGTENAAQAVPGILAGLQGNAALFSVQSLAPTFAAAAAGVASAAASGVNSPMSRTFEKDAADGPTASLANAVAKRDLKLLRELSSALGTLRARTVALASVADRLSRAAALSNPQAVSAALKTCQVDGVVQNITATPTSVTFSAKTAATQSVLVNGGNGNYSAAFLQTPAPGLTVSMPPRSKGVVNIVATDQTVGGSTYQLLIEDTTLQSRQLVTVIVGGPAAAAPPPANVPGAIAAATAGDKVKAAGTLKLANGATVNVDAVDLAGFGIQVLYTPVGDGVVTAETVADAAFAVNGVSNLLGKGRKLVTATPSKADAAAPHAGHAAKGNAGRDWGAGVEALSRAQISSIQRRLCMPEKLIDGRWAANTQAALRRDRGLRTPTSPPGPAPDDMLSLSEAKSLLIIPEDAIATRCVK